MPPRACVLVIAEPSLREALARAVRTNGYDVLACQTPLEAIQLLERHGTSIEYAVLSPASPQALELHELLTEEYPAIQRLVLSSAHHHSRADGDGEPGDEATLGENPSCASTVSTSK